MKEEELLNIFITSAKNVNENKQKLREIFNDPDNKKIIQDASGLEISEVNGMLGTVLKLTEDISNKYGNSSSGNRDEA